MLLLSRVSPTSVRRFHARFRQAAEIMTQPGKQMKAVRSQNAVEADTQVSPHLLRPPHFHGVPRPKNVPF